MGAYRRQIGTSERNYTYHVAILRHAIGVSERQLGGRVQVGAGAALPCTCITWLVRRIFGMACALLLNVCISFSLLIPLDPPKPNPW